MANIVVGGTYKYEFLDFEGVLDVTTGVCDIIHISYDPAFKSNYYTIRDIDSKKVFIVFEESIRFKL